MDVSGFLGWQDDAVGRVVLELGTLRAGTTYDAWFALQFGKISRSVRSHGRLRLRYSLSVTSARARVLRYVALPPTYQVHFKNRSTLCESAFAYRGKYDGRRYRSNVFRSHVQELQDTARDMWAGVRAFAFWKTPVLSAFCLVLYQVPAISAWHPRAVCLVQRAASQGEAPTASVAPSAAASLHVLSRVPPRQLADAAVSLQSWKLLSIPPAFPSQPPCAAVLSSRFRSRC